MNDEIVIAEAGNARAAALAGLNALGFKVPVTSDGATLEATNSQLRLIAEDPLGLLGLVKLDEIRGENWHPSDSEVDALLHLDEGTQHLGN